MTAPRQAGKRPLLKVGLVLAIGLMPLLGVAAKAAGPAPAALVVDSHTGLAISGFDPVAYFTDKAPRAGKPGLELSLAGGVWRFRNEGNRAEFAAHPDVYMPQFGGYDPVAISRGASVRGHPLFWSVTGERLYLFYSEKAREEFLADAGRIIAAAQRKWPRLARTIGR